jgi:siroheme synthase
MPIAVVENATLPRERQLRTTLGFLARDIAAHHMESPSIMVIGDVARELESVNAASTPALTYPVAAKSDRRSSQSAITLVPLT